MNLKQKSKSKPVLIVTGVVLLVLIGAGALYMLRREPEVSADAEQPEASVNSVFSFAGTPGWWQGATNETSMALFNYDESTKEGTCFTSVEQKPGTVDMKAELKWISDGLADDKYTVTPIGTKTLTMQTGSGPIEYELQQSKITTPPGNEKLKGGQEHGYIQLSGSYIKIIGYCDTAEELPATIPALQATEFKGDQ